MATQQFKPTARDWDLVARMARQCEANAVAAAEFRQHNFSGFAVTCEFTASSWAERAMQFAETVANRATPITKDTRWKDGKGRVWRVFDNLYFGRYFCVLADRPSYSGNWTAKQIRAALSTNEGGR